MSIQHVVGENWAGPVGAISLQKSITLTGGTEVNLDLSVAGSTTNQLHTIAIAVAGLQDVYMVSDQALTIKTNSSGSPQETITLAAGQPLVWYAGCGLTTPFAGNITALYITNGGTTAANFSFRSLAT